MYYLQSRYYDPAVGRFVNGDCLVSTGQGIIGYNMFTYCANNPVNCADTTGNVPGLLLYEFLKKAIEAIAMVAVPVIAVSSVQVINKAAKTATPVINRTVARAKDTINRTKREVYKLAKSLVDTAAGKYESHQPRVHHIVPVGSFSNRGEGIPQKIREMQTILTDVGIDPVNDPKNMVIVSHGYHKSLHKNPYFSQLHSSLVLAKGNRKAVERVLSTYKIILIYSDPYAY